MACNVFLTLPGDIKMPALGYGTWQSTDTSLENALEVALEVGYRHIDTAEIYGNEEVVGKVLKRWFDSKKIKREDIFLTTKLASTSMYADKVENCLKDSLKKLQLDYVDLYLIHFPITIVFNSSGAYADRNVDYLDIWKKMEEQCIAGRARSIGVSNFSIKKIERLLKNCRIKPTNNQVEMHAYLQQRELVEYCTKNGITVVAYAPLASRGYNAFLKEMGKSTKDVPDLFDDKTVQAIAKKYSKTPAQVLLRFLVQLGVAPIPKTVTPSRIKENYDIFNFNLDDQDMNKMRALDANRRVCDWLIFEKLADHPDFEF